MELLALQPNEYVKEPDGPSGITLLEAYSALAQKARVHNTAINLPSPGLLPLGDAGFWHMQLRTPT